MRIHNKYTEGTKILIGGHRGDRFHYPENTMPSFRAMQTLGCDAVETDVRMTKDGHLVLIHDRSVARTTGATGNIDEMTLEEVRALDAGSFKGEKFAGEKIPTVEEFLEFIAGTDLIVNWELKEYPCELGERAYTCADRLVELIDRYGVADRSIMNSFSEQILEYVNDKWPLKFQIHGYINYPKDHASKPLETFSDWAAIWRKDADHPTGFDEDYAIAAKYDAWPCILVPDKPEMYERAIAQGCRMFTSDNPELAIEILKKIGRR